MLLYIKVLALSQSAYDAVFPQEKTVLQHNVTNIKKPAPVTGRVVPLLSFIFLSEPFCFCMVRFARQCPFPPSAAGTERHRLRNHSAFPLGPGRECGPHAAGCHRQASSPPEAASAACADDAGETDGLDRLSRSPARYLGAILACRN